MPDTEIDFGSLDYRCDPRVDAEHLNGWISVRQGRDTSWSTFMWVRQMEDGLWAVIDDQGELWGTHTSGESAIYSVIGLPIPSAYIKDTRVQPLDRNGQPIGWDDDPTFFMLDSVDADVYYTHINRVPCWVARPGSTPVTTWDLLDEALHECLGDPDRPWNAED